MGCVNIIACVVIVCAPVEPSVWLTVVCALLVRFPAHTSLTGLQWQSITPVGADQHMSCSSVCLCSGLVSVDTGSAHAQFNPLIQHTSLRSGCHTEAAYMRVYPPSACCSARHNSYNMHGGLLQPPDISAAGTWTHCIVRQRPSSPFVLLLFGQWVLESWVRVATEAWVRGLLLCSSTLSGVTSFELHHPIRLALRGSILLGAHSHYVSDLPLQCKAHL